MILCSTKFSYSPSPLAMIRLGIIKPTKMPINAIRPSSPTTEKGGSKSNNAKHETFNPSLNQSNPPVTPSLSLVSKDKEIVLSSGLELIKGITSYVEKRWFSIKRVTEKRTGYRNGRCLDVNRAPASTWRCRHQLWRCSWRPAERRSCLD